MSLDRAGFVALAVLAVSVPAFALATRGRPPAPDLAGRPPSLLLGGWVRDWAIWVIGPLERLLVRHGVSPTLLNWVGLVGGSAAGVAFAIGDFGLAAWMIGAGGIADVLDGRVARARGIASPYGAFLDSTLDRFAETATFAGIGWRLADSPRMVLATILAAAGSLLVSYTRARGEALGAGPVGGLMQRPERLGLLALAALFDGAATGLGWERGTLVAATVVVIAAGTMATAGYRTAVIARALARSTGRPPGTDGND